MAIGLVFTRFAASLAQRSGHSSKARNLMRFSMVIAALALAAPLGFGVGSASAQPLPQAFQGQSIWGGRPNTPSAGWCAHFNAGSEWVTEDCSFASFSACQWALGNPSNGFCTQTYVDAGPPPAPPRNQKRRVQQ
jgi:hypothetical protein